MILDPERFWTFASALRIPSKERGSVPLDPLGTQRYLVQEIARGLEDGVHAFVGLKGRQQGFSTVMAGLDLYWHLDHSAVQGAIITDSDENHTYFRDIITEMLETLPPAYRLPVRVNNDEMLAWETIQRANKTLFGGSRITYQVAGGSRKRRAKLGRSRGINYLHADEVGYWTDQRGVSSLEASLAEDHPLRLYVWGGTANGYDVLWEMWKDAEHAVTKRRIFLGWWRKETYRVERGTPLWERYSPEGGLTADERTWIRAVRKEYDFAIQPEQIAWYRAQLVEKFRGDEAMLAQEHPNLPDEAFQSFGSKFIPISTIRRLRDGLKDAEEPLTFQQYVWAKNIDEVSLRRLTGRQAKLALLPKGPEGKPDPLLTIWENPSPMAAYAVGARSAGSTTAACRDSVATVWRLYPDRMEQVAEYVSEDDATYQFSWAVLHLLAAYGSRARPCYLALELQGTGQQVFDNIIRLQQSGWGLAARPPEVGKETTDFQTPIRHYLHRRNDSITGRAVLQWQSRGPESALLFHGLRDEIEREVVAPRSEPLVNELAMLRRGEGDEGDMIAGSGASARDGRAITTALVVRHYRTVVDEIGAWVLPKGQDPIQPVRVDQALVQGMLHTVGTRGRA